MNNQVINLAVFGSTGSIGKSALEITEKYPERFKIVSLVANNNLELLEQQINKFRPKYAGLFNTGQAEKLKLRINQDETKIFAGDDINILAGFDDYDLMLAAVTGFAGLRSVLTAIKKGKKIALANKESMVAAGELVLSEASRYGSKIVPVDSEHTAIFQLLDGRNFNDLDSITITASGGPFLRRDKSNFDTITPQEALKHPRWKMGNKITLDSATMFNKALEFIEAKWLFNLPQENIEVVVHPQSIIHSMINFKDGSTLAHMSQTDMKVAIAYALNFPENLLPAVVAKLNFAELGSLEFVELDNSKFPAINIAREALKMGKAACCVLNSANEYAGVAFMQDRIKFNDIYKFVNDALSQFGSLNYGCYDELLEIDTRVRDFLNTRVQVRRY